MLKTEQLIEKTAVWVKSKLEGEGSGHDWWHVLRVWENAKSIGKKEQVDMLIVELTALLHDIADHKFHGGDYEVGPRIAREWLEKLGLEEEKILHICEIIRSMSFSSSITGKKLTTKEGLVVQDADRLDSLGAIGIARTFAYGGHKGHEMHNPDVKPIDKSIHKEQAKQDSQTGINHFYEKLLLLKDMMNTKTGKQIAKSRHVFMEDYLKEFFAEWEGDK